MPLSAGYEAAAEGLVARFGLSTEQARAVARRGELVVVAAGAGTGKTTTMACRYVETALRLAAQGPADRPPRRVLERIAAVTFTELAAAELRARIAAVFARVAPGLEPRLQRFASEAMRLEGDLPIGTIHALCARLLRDLAFTGEVAPDFEILDELGRELLWKETYESSLDRLARQDPELIARLLADKDEAVRIEGGVRSLARSLPIEALEALRQRPLRALERAAERAAVELMHRVAAEPGVREPLLEAEARRHALREACGGRFEAAMSPALRWVRGHGSLALATRPHPTLGATANRLARLRPADRTRLQEASRAVRKLARAAKLVNKGLQPEALAKELRWTRDMAATAAAAAAAFETRKRDLGVVDFDDLERLAERALAPAGSAGALLEGAPRPGEAAPPFDEILVDEFQDTSRIQVRILRALAGSALSCVFAVGDPKQSIYRFRGADVAVFNQVAEAAPSGAAALTVNRRSTPEVLGLVNALFERLMPASAPEDRPWVAPMQRLRPFREPLARPPLPPLVLVPWDASAEAPLPASELRRRDARVTARAVARARTRLSESGAAGEGELAVLLRAVRGEKRAYADAIGALGLPVAVEAGGTFTRDAAAALGIAALRALALPGHRAAWTAVLRGPLVGLDEDTTDRILTRELAPGERGPRDVLRELVANEPLMLGAVLPRLVALLEAASSLAPLSERLRDLVQRAGLRSRQLDKLVAQAAELEARGLSPLEIVEWLEALFANDRDKRVPDPPGAGVDVRALTVHAAKGLEFELVVVPQLADPLLQPGFAPPDVVEAPEGGLRVGLQVPGGVSLVREANRALERDKELEERTRLLYVALTRATNHVVLPVPVGLPPSARDVAARPILQLCSAGGLDLTDPRLEGPAALNLPDGTRLEVEVWRFDDVEDEAARPAPSPVRRRPRRPTLGGGAEPATWSVTRLASLAFCPAYYAQAPVAPWPARHEGEEDGRAGSSSAERGVRIHAWLEGVTAGADLDAPPPAALGAEGFRLQRNLRAILDAADASDPALSAAFDGSGRLAVELPLELVRANRRISGTVDRLVVHESEAGLSATIIDYKTGTTGFSGPRGRHASYAQAHRFQLAAYAVMLGELLGERLIEPVCGRVLFVDLGASVCWDWTLEDARRELDRVLAELDRPGSLLPNRRGCEGCRMQRFCPEAAPSPGDP